MLILLTLFLISGLITWKNDSLFRVLHFILRALLLVEVLLDVGVVEDADFLMHALHYSHIAVVDEINFLEIDILRHLPIVISKEKLRNILRSILPPPIVIGYLCKECVLVIFIKLCLCILLLKSRLSLSLYLLLLLLGYLFFELLHAYYSEPKIQQY
jgi:hypothetical protein